MLSSAWLYVRVSRMNPKNASESAMNRLFLDAGELIDWIDGERQGIRDE